MKDFVVAELKKLKNGRSLETLSLQVGVSKSTLSKVLQYPAYQISDEVFQRISEALK
ncbi:MAG: helix-turn-helix domain-containing protein [Nitrospirae bacterium]|nr:helix-turn-helix domain-containing protein [Nitrospirota bacterium]